MTEAQPRFVKVLGEGLVSFHGGSGEWTVGTWRSVQGALVACKNGLHYCTLEQLPNWIGPVIAPFEPSGEQIEADDKWVCRKGRIGQPFETWNERTQRLFAADCAEHVLPNFEKRYPEDKRPREAIEVARRYANGEATAEELAAASSAAYSAAAGAAYAAAYAAASSTAYAAVYTAAYRAAYRAASSAAYAAVYTAAYVAERRWQSERLAFYLGVSVPAEVQP